MGRLTCTTLETTAEPPYAGVQDHPIPERANFRSELSDPFPYHKGYTRNTRGQPTSSTTSTTLLPEQQHESFLHINYLPPPTLWKNRSGCNMWWVPTDEVRFVLWYACWNVSKHAPWATVDLLRQSTSSLTISSSMFFGSIGHSF
jgi:hypothetical protein